MEARPDRDLLEILRDEMVMGDRIEALLADEAMTVPEIAEALGVPSREAMLWVMAMWRYGRLKELPKGRAEDYFQYAPAERGERNG